jgi:ABC-2 type transport system permease protein
MFIHILRFKAIMFRKVTLSGSAQAMIKNVGSAIVFGSFALTAFFFSRFLTGFILQKIGIGLFLFHRFISMLLFVFFVAINVGNIVVSFSTLYRSPEVTFLLSTPVSYLNIFIIKFLDNFFYSSGTLFLVGFSVLLGYGTYFGMPWYFYPWIMFGVLIPFMFLAACIAVLILLLLMKIAEKISIKKLVGILVVVYFVQIYLYFSLTSPVHMVNEVMRYYPYVNRYFGNLDPPLTKYLPNFWVSQILYFSLAGNMKIATGFSALLLLASAAAFIGVILAGGKYFYSTWMTSLSIKSFRVRQWEVVGDFFKFEKKSVLSPQTESVLKKEYWQFFREPSQWMHFGVMLVLVTVFLASVSDIDFHLADPMLKTAVYIVVFIFNVFLISSIALRFSFPMMSLEGDAYWTIRSAPITASKVYWIKWSAVAMLLMSLALPLVFFSNIPYQQIAIFGLTSTPSMLFIVAAVVSLNFGMGSYFVNYSEKNPIRIASSQGATLSFLIGLVFLILLVVIYFFPVLSVFRARSIGYPPRTAYMYYALGMMAISSCIVGTFFHVVGIRALKRDF